MPEALSVEAAIAALEAGPAPDEAEVAAAPEVAAAEPTAEELAPEGADESEAQPEAEDPADPEEAIGAEEAEADTPARPASEAPRSWDAAERDEFAKLPRAIQDIVLSRETERDTRVSTAIQEANEAKKVALTDAAKVQTLANELTEFLPQALKTFETRWGKAPDWVAHAQAVGVEQATRDRWAYDQERAELGELARKEDAAQKLAHQNFVRTEADKLATLSPEMSDPKTGMQLRQDVVRHALDQGYARPEDIPNVSAAQLHMAWKAMQWDRLPAALKAGKIPDPLNPAQPAPKPAAKPAAKPTVRPTAAAPAPSATRATQQAGNRFSQTRSIDDAVALLATRNR